MVPDGHKHKILQVGGGFCQDHVLAISQAVADIQKSKGSSLPILVGGDTRLMSEETARISSEVLVANGLEVALADHPVPTPVFSFMILSKMASSALIGTASHNPAEQMGLKFNPEHGGPAEEAITSEIARLANYYLAHPLEIKRAGGPIASSLLTLDLVNPYINALLKMVDVDAINASGLEIGIHPLGGATAHYFSVIGNTLQNLKVVDGTQDPTFGFLPVDHDGAQRMDPSSIYPMSPVLSHLKPKGSKKLVGSADPDGDRFGAGTKKGGLISPNHALAVMANYLLNPANRAWPQTLGIGRTIGTTHLLDRIAKAHNNRPVDEVNVGWKYYVDGLKGGLKGKYALVGEESAGMSVFNWTTEKDGMLAVLLLAEIMAKTGKDIKELYDELAEDLGRPFYVRLDIPTSVEFMEKVKKELKISAVQNINEFGGERVTNRRDSDGLKVYTENGWFLVRGSGTEPHMLKVYGEHFGGEDALKKLLDSAIDRLIGPDGIMKYPVNYNWGDYRIIS